MAFLCITIFFYVFLLTTCWDAKMLNLNDNYIKMKEKKQNERKEGGERYIRRVCIHVFMNPPLDITNKRLIKYYQQIVQIALSLVTMTIYALMLRVLLPTAETLSVFKNLSSFIPICFLLSLLHLWVSFSLASCSSSYPCFCQYHQSCLSHITNAHLNVYAQYSQTDLPSLSTWEFTLKVVIKDKHTHVHTKPQLMRDAVSSI